MDENYGLAIILIFIYVLSIISNSYTIYDLYKKGQERQLTQTESKEKTNAIIVLSCLIAVPILASILIYM